MDLIQSGLSLVRRWLNLIKNKIIKKEVFILSQIHPSELEARKLITDIASQLKIKPGIYSRDQAKNILNQLKTALVERINGQVSQYNYEASLPYVIHVAEVSMAEYEYGKVYLKRLKRRKAAFDGEKAFMELEQNFIIKHKSQRYLVEKFVQIRPNGQQTLDSNRTEYLLALTHIFLEISTASDAIHYDFYPLKLVISEHFTANIQYEGDIMQQQRLLMREKAKKMFSKSSDYPNQITSHNSAQYFKDLDQTFMLDFKFKYRELVFLLAVLHQWPYATRKEPLFCKAGLAEIKAECRKQHGIQGVRVERIIKFITLDTGQILSLKGEPKNTPDLPVWENNRRIHRYNIKPLIRIGDWYYWGPHSARATNIFWNSYLIDGRMPADLDADNVHKCLRLENRKRQILLEKQTLEIVKRFTQFAENVKYKRRTHPQKLGEYDVLAYLPNENIILNIECKDINKPTTIKDQRLVKAKIFGVPNKSKGSLVKVEDREHYLKENSQKFRDILQWPIKQDCAVVSLYVSRSKYWWTQYPPRKTTVQFETIDYLHAFLQAIQTPTL